MNKQKIVFDVLTTRRSVRKYKKKRITEGQLKRILTAAQLAPNACNIQMIKYLVVESDEKKRLLSKHLKLANGLKPEERNTNTPNTYIIVMMDFSIIEKFNKKSNLQNSKLIKMHYISAGCALGNIVNQAKAEGLGSCIIGAVDKNKIRKLFNINPNYKIVTVVALGYPDEKIMTKQISEKKPTGYYKNKKGVLVVPKVRQKIRRV